MTGIASTPKADAAISQQQSIEILKATGQKYTNVPLILCLLVSLVGGSLTVGAAYMLKTAVPYLFGLILERGWTQYVTVYFFWFAVGMLFFKWRNLQKERGAFGLDFIKTFTTGREVVGTKTFYGEQQVIEENLDAAQKDLLLVQRINKAIKQLRINNSPADVANVLQTVAENDAAIINSSYVLIKFMIWAIPVMGFVGTVVGMTDAIGSFDSVLKSIDQVGFAGVKKSLGNVTAGLAVAFDTTFLALVLSAILNLITNFLQKDEEDLLSAVDEFTTDNIINKYSTVRDSVRQMGAQGQPVDSDEGVRAMGESMLKEMKNLQRQNQAHADNMQAQLGGIIEAVNQLEQSMKAGQAAPPPAPVDLGPGLQEIQNQMQEQTQLLRQLAQGFRGHEITGEVLEKLPAAMEQLGETSRKLGDLFSKIYNRTFA